MNSVGAKIKKYREERGFTQDYFARELELTQSSYGRLEKDDRRLNVEYLKKIAEILNVSVSLLFGEKANNMINENKGDNAQANIGSIVHNDKELIMSLKEEIAFLRATLEKIMHSGAK